MKTIVIVFLSLLFLCCNSNKEQYPASLSLSRIVSYTEAPPPALIARENEESFPAKQRMIIKTASLTLEVEIYDSAFVKLQKLVSVKSGFIVSSDINSNIAGRKTGTVRVRVPSASFDETLDAITKLSSHVISKSIEGNDVTEEYYDVSARLENKKKIEARYREILKSAKTVEDILSVEKNLGEIREEIERLEGRKRFLGDQSALSTIRINLQEPKAYVEYERKGFWSKIGDGFRQGLTGFGDVLSTTISVLLSSIPLVALLFLGIFISRKFFKRYVIFHRKS